MPSIASVADILDYHNDKKKAKLVKDDNSKATDDSDTHVKVKSKPKSNNHGIMMERK